MKMFPFEAAILQRLIRQEDERCLYKWRGVVIVGQSAANIIRFHGFGQELEPC